MQRNLPLALCFIMGILMIIQFFSPHPVSQQFFDTIIKWIRIISAFALVLGVRSISLRHIETVRRKRSGFIYSLFTLISMVVTALLGLIFGVGAQAPIRLIFNNIMVPLGATMFSILAFYMASAAYRAFRARTFEATLLLIAAFIVMLGMVPIGNLISPHFSSIAEWLLSVPNMAAKRGILFGVALGVIATSLKIILGIERGWLGGRR
uniref:Uncharacterized protein n=1 Tax=candidate division WOR-3 bacterium TaxID=2052148 RepID=A0A7V4E3X0_UNCW3